MSDADARDWSMANVAEAIAKAIRDGLVFDIKGSATVAELNTMPLDQRTDGDIWAVKDSGLLVNPEGEPLAVTAGDLVMWAGDTWSRIFHLDLTGYATVEQLNAAIAAATLNRGKDYGPMSVDEINAIAETIPTGSTVYVEHLGAGDAKVINDGYSDGTMASFSVEVGEDLKYYRSPDNSLHGWYSTEANVKIKQPANYSGGIAVDSAQDASSGSAGIEFIQSFKQDTNGNIRDIVKAQVDIVDSTSSTRTNAAATPNSVKSAYDLANTANTGLANKLDKTGDGKDVTATFTEASSRANIGTGEKLSVIFGKIKKWFTDLGTAAFKNVPASGNASSTEVVLGNDTRLSDARTPTAHNHDDRYYTETESDAKYQTLANKVDAWQGTPDDTHYPSEKLVKDGLDAKADADNAVIVSNSIIYTASGNTRSYYKVAEIDVLQNYTSAILSCDYLVAPGNDHGERGTLDLNFRVKDDNSWGLKDFYARQEYSTVASNYGLQFIVIATKNTTGTHIDLYVSLACGLTGFELSRRFRKSEGSTLGDEWTFVATPTASSTAPTVPEGAVSSTITPEIRDVVMLTSADNIDNINSSTYAPKNFILHGTDWPAGTFPTGVSTTNCYLQCFGHANRQNQVLYIEINGVQNIYIRKSYGGAPPNLNWRAWQSERDASWISSGVFDAARIPTSLPNVTAGSATTATDYASGGGIANALAGKQNSLSWINDSEAVSIWADAKTAAANAS